MNHVKMRTMILVCTAAVIIAGVMWMSGRAPDPARAAFPGINGKIAFESTRDAAFPQNCDLSCYEIYTMNGDGSSVLRLTTNSNSDRNPAFSADGQKIAFSSDRDGNMEIYIMNANGTGQQRLTFSGGSFDAEPSFSPDSSKIAFATNRDGNFEVYSMDSSDGGNLDNLTSSASGDGSGPAWSPDGAKIAFTSDRDGNPEIYVMNFNGSGQTRLTKNSAIDDYPDWSPDKSRIVFHSERDGNCEIYVMDANGSDQTRLTNNSACDHHPAWSPDGSKITFSSMRDGNIEIYEMDPDGTDQVRRTTNSVVDDEPNWGPAPPTPTPTNTASVTPTRTNTPTPSATPTPGGPWTLIGQVTPVKKHISGAVWHVIIPANGQTSSLVQDQRVVTVSNPSDALHDYPRSFKVLSYKAPDLYLEQVPSNECASIPGPTPTAVPATIDLYAGPCTTPAGSGSIGGVYDMVVDAGNPAFDLFHCIVALDHDESSNTVKAAAQCADSTGLFGSGNAAEPINDPPGEGSDTLVGPPPPPPYTLAPPAIGVGTYSANTAVATVCLPDLASNSLVFVITIPNFAAQRLSNGKLTGSVDMRLNQTNSNCEALTPSGPPSAPLGMTLYPADDIDACPSSDCVQAPYRLTGNVLHGYPDWDGDGCTDADELHETKPNNTAHCGDDPWNPFDVTPPSIDLSGSYNLRADLVRHDVGAPGFYQDCVADVNQTGKSLTTRLLCYHDTPLFTVNPQAASPKGSKTCPPAAAEYCGDGKPGAPPPGNTVGTYPTNRRLFADVDDKHTVLTGTFDDAQDVIKLRGCFEDRDWQSVYGHIYWDLVVNARTGHGQVNFWTSLSNGMTLANCLAGTPPGAGTVVPVHMVRQAAKATPPAGRDFDLDSCPNKAELTDDPFKGGLRDPSNHYDYFNPTKDGLNRVDDILAVVNEYFNDDPPGMPDMKSQTDRTAIQGGNAWNIGPPNGQQRVDDILAQVKQYFHDC